MSSRRRTSKKKSRKTLSASPLTASPANSAFSNRQDWLNGVTSSSSTSVFEALGALSPVPATDGAFVAPGTGHGASQVAAEQLGHLLDGWRYLSAAFYAAMTNSPESAVHFSYYAELRAALSLVCSTGLRIRFRDAYYLNAAGVAVPLSTWNTHSCVWAVWSEWQKRPDVAQTFQRIVRIHPLVSLGDLMQALSSQIGGAMLGTWGLDLIEPGDDHDVRNAASYESVVTVAQQSALAPKTWDRLLRAWELMLPGGAGIKFDEALSAYCFYGYVTALTGERNLDALVGLPAFKRVTTLLENQLSVEPDFFASVLQRNFEYFDLFEIASQKGNAADNVLLRALFLLRVGSAFVSHALPTGSGVRERVKGWMDLVGVIRPGVPARLTDLSEDYLDALDNVPKAATQHNLCGVDVDRSGMRLSRVEGVLAWAL